MSHSKETSNPASSTGSPVSGDVLRTSVDDALFGGSLRGIIATFHENERPLGGLAGLLDWRFQGAITQCLKAGFLTGKAGECAYFPVTRNGTTFHLLLTGAGKSSAFGARTPLPPESVRALMKNLTSLR